MPETNARIKVCHDTAANFKTNNPTLLVGEWALETDTKRMKIGDGTTSYNALPYSTAEESEEWEKPSDWIDIRSGAFDNSIYLLVGHSIPTESEGVYTVDTYPKLQFKATIENSGQYDVYIDGNKYVTSNHNTSVLLDWASLYANGTVSSLYPVSYPSNYITHIIRITPSVSTNHITNVYTSRPSGETGTYRIGILWAHFELDNEIGVYLSSGNSYSDPANITAYILEAITSKNDLLKVKNLRGIVGRSTQIRHLPELDGGNRSLTLNEAFAYNFTRINKIRISNSVFTDLANAFNGVGANNIEFKNCSFSGERASTSFALASKLKRVPMIPIAKNLSGFLRGNTNLVNTSLDFSQNKEAEIIGAHGTDSSFVSGIKGVVVSNEAPFSSTTAPQLNVSYTGLERAALVNLFKSMPYRVGYTAVGSPTITDGVLINPTDKQNTIKTAQAINVGDGPWEMQFKLLNPTRKDSFLFRINGSSNTRITLNHTYGLAMYLNYPVSSTRVSVDDLASVWTNAIDNSASQFYWKIACAGKDVNNQYPVTVSCGTDGTNWTSQAVTLDYTLASGVVQFSSYQSFAEGTAADYDLDLNETWIKVGGKPWSVFDGISRSISVVGCTGAANWDETEGADVRAIAENKGWEVTYR